MPDRFRDALADGIVPILPKGVANRNQGMKHVLQMAAHTKSKVDMDSSVLYLADDDNTYDLELFEEIRKTKRVSVFPVGLVGDEVLSTPIVAENGSVIDFYDKFRGNRTFMVDMAGFAINVGFLMKARIQSSLALGFCYYKVYLFRSAKLGQRKYD